jgi:hypothetical protein
MRHLRKIAFLAVGLWMAPPVCAENLRNPQFVFEGFSQLFQPGLRRGDVDFLVKKTSLKPRPPGLSAQVTQTLAFPSSDQH